MAFFIPSPIGVYGFNRLYFSLLNQWFKSLSRYFFNTPETPSEKHIVFVLWGFLILVAGQNETERDRVRH